MSRFAPVVPIHVAMEMQKIWVDEENPRLCNLFGDYHLPLAHDVLEHPNEYAEVFARVRKLPEKFIIMDNSLVELGYAMSMKQLLEAADIVKPDVIVVPDAMGDGAETRELAIEFVRKYTQMMATFDKDYNPPQLMGVIQGEDLEDCMRTVSTFYALPLIDYVSVPRIVTAQQGTRMFVLSGLSKSPYMFSGIHLLGFSDNLLDDVSCARVPGVIGIDSAVPIRAAIKGIPLSLGKYQDYGKREDYWERAWDPDNQPLLEANMMSTRSWISMPQD